MYLWRKPAASDDTSGNCSTQKFLKPWDQTGIDSFAVAFAEALAVVRIVDTPEASGPALDKEELAVVLVAARHCTAAVEAFLEEEVWLQEEPSRGRRPGLGGHPAVALVQEPDATPS